MAMDPYDYCDTSVPSDNTFVSPITYDPITGIYTPTFSAENIEFLRVFGQEIIMHGDGVDCAQSTCSTSSASQNSPQGYYTLDATYYSGTSQQSDSFEQYADGLHMLRYLASPLASHAYPSNSGNAPTSSFASSDDVSAKASNHDSDEEIIQPPMIVPSQQHLVEYLSAAQPQYAPPPVVSPITYTPPTADAPTHQLSGDVRSTTPKTGAFPHTLSQFHEWNEPSTPVFDQDYSIPPCSSEVLSPMPDAHHCGSEDEDMHAADEEPGHVYPSRSSSPSSTRSTSTVTAQERPPLPNPLQPEKKLVLACLFCRARKIACGPPLPGTGESACE
ncbi:hypothetical protein HWV62_40569 [Athelia sp. TMB]|nr:hypothetical protein HWV62_40569 [Athelia sp. TMB]